MPLLPQDRYFLEHIKSEHNIDLTENDLRELNEFHFWLTQDYNRLASDTNSIFPDVENGKIIAFAAIAIAGAFLFPALIGGVSWLTGALFGAAIGWRVLGLGKQQNAQKTQEDKTEKISNTPEFTSTPSLPAIGGVIPMAFCNRRINPNGGVRTSGIVVQSRIDTLQGVQKLYALYVLSLGRTGYINTEDTYLNNQPKYNFFADEVFIQATNGEYDQAIPGGFNTKYSQSVIPQNNNGLGIDLKGFVRDNASNVNYIFINGDDYETFSPADVYRVNGVEFRIVGKNKGNQVIYTDRPISTSTGNPIFVIYKFRYQTIKKCSEIILNIVDELWAKDANGNSVTHGMLFSVYLNGVFITRIFDRNKKETENKRWFGLTNLAYQKHIIDLVPEDGVAGGVYTVEMSDNGNIWVKDRGITVSGKSVFLAVEQYNDTVPSDSEMIPIIAYNDTKKQVSTSRGACARITSVNEVSYPADLGHPRFTNYNRLATSSFIITSSPRLNGDPSPSHMLNEAIQGRALLEANVAGIGSGNNVLYDLTTNFLSSTNTNCYVRNLDKNIESRISGVSTYYLVTELSLQWSVNDRYIVFAIDSLVYFPDIYTHLLTSKEGGLGKLVKQDYFIDYINILAAKKFCIQNRFFYDDIITETTSFDEWATKESLGSLLFPTKFAGKYGLVPESDDAPVALFNGSNIKENTYSEKGVQKQRINCIHITYRDGTDTKYVRKTVSVVTREAYERNQPLYPESLDFNSITNESQAIRVAQTYINSRIYQNKVVTFTTGLLGFALREGRKIIVQHVTTQAGTEVSGFVVQADPLVNGSQDITLSVPLNILISPTQYSAAAYYLRTSETKYNLRVEVVNGKLRISGLTNPLTPPQDNYTGDFIIVGKDVEKRRIFRVSRLEPQEDASVQVTAVLWKPEINSTNNLIVIN